jgi:ketosteroid isomerase-like protein
MSQQNVEVVRRLYEADQSGDFDALNEILDLAVDMVGAIGGIEEGTVIEGREKVRDALLVDPEIWAERRYEVQGFLDADEHVVALVREYRRGQGSGAEVQADIAVVYRLKDRKIMRIEPYMSQAEALEAVGLSA